MAERGKGTSSHRQILGSVGLAAKSKNNTLSTNGKANSNTIFNDQRESFHSFQIIVRSGVDRLNPSQINFSA